MELTPPDIKALKRGEEPAWEKAFRFLWPHVYRSARHPRANLTQEEAEDAASMAMAQLPSRISEVKDENELRALAVTIAYCRAISLARHEHAVKRDKSASFSIEERQENTEGHYELEDQNDEQLGELDSSELLSLLREGLDELDDTSKALLMECYMRDTPYKELSEKYNLTENAVGMRIYWAKQKIRKYFSQKRPHLLKELNEYLR
jgi:RNA polymerase sigma factor (sigma-70 family)